MNYLSEMASYHEYTVDELTDNFKVVFYSQQATQKVTPAVNRYKITM